MCNDGPPEPAAAAAPAAAAGRAAAAGAARVGSIARPPPPAAAPAAAAAAAPAPAAPPPPAAPRGFAPETVFVPTHITGGENVAARINPLKKAPKTLLAGYEAAELLAERAAAATPAEARFPARAVAPSRPAPLAADPAYGQAWCVRPTESVGHRSGRRKGGWRVRPASIARADVRET
eukprot:gene1770-38771_t